MYTLILVESDYISGMSILDHVDTTERSPELVRGVDTERLVCARSEDGTANCLVMHDEGVSVAGGVREVEITEDTKVLSRYYPTQKNPQVEYDFSDNSHCFWSDSEDQILCR